MSSGIEKGNDRGNDQVPDLPDVPAAAVAGKTSARRGFLLGAGAAAGAAGAAAIVLRTTPQVAAGPVLEPVAGKEPDKARGYHVTAHIRKYYDTTKV